MKKVIIGIILGIISISFTTKVFGQKAHGQKAEMRIENRVQKMKDALNLSDDQVAKITTIFRDAQQKVKTVKTSTTDTVAFKTQRKEINKDAQNQIKQVLSEDQRKKWKDMKKNEK